MPSILAIADIHAEVENLFKFLNLIKETENVDFIVCPGDFVDSFIPKTITAEEITYLIIEELKTLGKPVITVPGNQDGEILEILKKETYCVHENGVVFDEIGFFGYGGARTPANTSLEPTEEEISKGLINSFERVEKTKIKIMVTHMPPLHTKLDLLPFGVHVGSKAIRDFIIEKKPQVCISAHIHEAFGEDILEKTYLINPGRFTEGRYGIIEIKDESIYIKVKNLMEKDKLRT